MGGSVWPTEFLVWPIDNNSVAVKAGTSTSNIIMAVGALTDILNNTNSSNLDCSQVGCTSGTSYAFCNYLGCQNGGNSHSTVYATEVTEPISRFSPYISLKDITGLEVGEDLVIIDPKTSSSVSWSTYQIAALEFPESERRLFSGRDSRRLTTPGGQVKLTKNPKTASAKAIAVANGNNLATTTTHDPDRWWPHWAWWLLGIGLGLCLLSFACVVAVVLCVGQKKSPKKRTLSSRTPEVQPQAQAVTTTAVPMSYAQPMTYQQPQYATTAVPQQQYAYQQPTYAYQQPATRAVYRAY